MLECLFSEYDFQQVPQPVFISTTYDLFEANVII